MTQKTFLIIGEDFIADYNFTCAVTEEEARQKAKGIAERHPGLKFYIFEANEVAVCEVKPVTYFTAGAIPGTKVVREERVDALPVVREERVDALPVEDTRGTLNIAAGRVTVPAGTRGVPTREWYNTLPATPINTIGAATLNPNEPF